MIKKIKFGVSVEGKDLLGYTFTENKHLPYIFILAGVHGDEIEGLWIANHCRKMWQDFFPYSFVQVFLVPEVNPDGVLRNTRTNSNKVDLNRNLPTTDWGSSSEMHERYPPGPYACSEPENQALVSLIESYQPIAILTLHSYLNPQINNNGNDETGVIDWADELYKVSPYKKITRGEGIGYATPGSLGTYAGYEKGIPTITYELLRGSNKEKIIQENIVVIEKTLEYFESKHLTRNI